jgi:hypothetical protein
MDSTSNLKYHLVKNLNSLTVISYRNLVVAPTNSKFVFLTNATARDEFVGGLVTQVGVGAIETIKGLKSS